MSIIEEFTEKVSKTAKAAARRSGEFIEITKLNVNIGIEEDKILKLYADIGQEIYQSYIKNGQVLEELKEKCEEISLHEQNIKDIKQKILELRNVKKCSSCNYELDIDFCYCCNCGAKQEKVDISKGDQA